MALSLAEDAERVAALARALPPAAHAVPVEPAEAHAAVLRQLGSPASWSLDESVSEPLGPACEAAGGMTPTIAPGSTQVWDRTTDYPVTKVGHSPVRSR